MPEYKTEIGNVNPNKPSSNSLSQRIVEAIQERNQLDYKLYQYAAKLMDEAIAVENSEFYEELEQYKALSFVPQDSAGKSPAK